MVNELSEKEATLDAVDLAGRLRPVLLRLNRHFRREAHALGIPAGQAALLAGIHNHPGIGVRDLAAREAVSPPAMTRYVDRMEKAGLVTRTRSKADARRVELVLTPKGVRTLRSVRSRRTAWLAERLSSLPPDELAAIEAAVEPFQRLVEEQS